MDYYRKRTNSKRVASKKNSTISGTQIRAPLHDIAERLGTTTNMTFLQNSKRNAKSIAKLNAKHIVKRNAKRIARRIAKRVTPHKNDEI